MSSSQPAAVSLQHREDGCLLVLAGAVGVASAAALHAAALEATDRAVNLTIDCSAVTYLDGAAIQLLLALDAALVAHGLGARFQDVPIAMRTLLAVAGCEPLLDGRTAGAAGGCTLTPGAAEPAR